MRVYLYRGLFGGVFSTGMDELARKLNGDGHVATVHSWTERPAIEQQAIARGAADGPVCIVGHSLGGNSASYMAHNLLAAGIPVAYVGTVDATAPKPAPTPPTPRAPVPWHWSGPAASGPGSAPRAPSTS